MLIPIPVSSTLTFKNFQTIFPKAAEFDAADMIFYGEAQGFTNQVEHDASERATICMGEMTLWAIR